MPVLHAKITPPSGYDRWAVCLGSIAFTRDMPDRSSAYADNGTCAHFLAEQCLILDEDADKHLDREISMYKVGDEPGVGFADEMPAGAMVSYTCEADERMVECVQDYLDNLQQYRMLAALFWPETQVDISEIVGIPDQFGTSDAIVLVALGHATYELQVHDLKSGEGVFVSPFRNGQGLLYWLGAYLELSKRYKITRGRIVIHQPKINKRPREWDFTIDEALRFADETKVRAQRAHALLSAGPDEIRAALTPTEKGCQFCPAHGNCEAEANAAFKESLGAEMSAAGFQNLDAPRPLEGVDLARAFPKLRFLRNFADAVEERTFEAMANGQQFVGLELGDGREGNRKWVDESKVEPELFNILGDGAFAPRKVVSPTKAEAAFKERFGKKNRGVWDEFSATRVTRDPPKKVIRIVDITSPADAGLF